MATVTESVPGREHSSARASETALGAVMEVRLEAGKRPAARMGAVSTVVRPVSKAEAGYLTGVQTAQVCRPTSIRQWAVWLIFCTTSTHTRRPLRSRC